MNPEILLRLAWAIALAGVGLAFYWLINRLVLRHARGQVSALHLPNDGTPAILYFTTPACVPCKTIQRPAIHRLQKLMGDRLQVVEVDASAQPDIARQWGVMSVPTTFIIDPQGQPRHVNHGVTTADQLLDQIRHIS